MDAAAAKVKDSMGEAAKANEAIKKAGETLGKAADSVSGTVSGAAESIGKSGAFKASYLKGVVQCMQLCD